MQSLRNSKDLLAGLMFVAIGLVALVASRDFEFGTPRQMGAGFFPIVLGGLITALGAVLLATALFARRPDPVTGWAIRPLLAISAAVIVFAVTLRPLGLVVAIVAATLLSRLAVPERGWLDAIALSAVLVVVCTGLFVFGLGMPLRLGWQP